MLMPSIFGENLIDDFFGYPMGTYNYHQNDSLMKTDVQEMEDSFQLDISLPGFQKDEITAELKDGYLTVQASTSKNEDSKDGSKYIRRERYSGTCSRSFYVGEDVTQEDIKAKYENGVLSLVVPKAVEKPKEEEKHYISIEG
jgi:HSP20 family molecular chaperone IbpA